VKRCRKHIRPILFFLAAIFVLFWVNGFKILKQEIFSSATATGLGKISGENPLLHNKIFNTKPTMPKK
jgi:hypothetical protein